MSTVIVVFHHPDDDQAGELNDKLRQKGVLVDSKNRVGLVQFPDGWLIVCYDDTPNDQIKGAIRDKVNAVQPERKILLIHRTTRERNPGIAVSPR